MDCLILPGALNFTSWGYKRSQRTWRNQAISLRHRTAVITGATSGLGRVTAEALAGLSARVILVGRSEAKLKRANREITLATGNRNITCEVADLSLMSSVESLARRLLNNEPEIHILINNAAVLPGERVTTAEGLETAFATNLLSPYLLTSLLIPRLRESKGARIVNVLSGGMYLADINVADLQSTQGQYDGSRAYARAKRGLMILTEIWARQLAGSGVVVNAMHPGWADTPGVKNSLPGFHKLMRPFLRTPEQGADTIVWLASAPEAGQVSGKFWLDRVPHLSAILPGTSGSPGKRRKLIEALKLLVETAGTSANRSPELLAASRRKSA